MLNQNYLKYVLKVIKSIKTLDQYETVEQWVQGMKLANEEMSIIETNLKAKLQELDFK